ncbi:hypothetical protein HY379_01265 [Candidatus Saccharibacteria bacterium]|nr:hypothetical protein [Candidatus Saccharibacteria bacterium]
MRIKIIAMAAAAIAPHSSHFLEPFPDGPGVAVGGGGVTGSAGGGGGAGASGTGGVCVGGVCSGVWGGIELPLLDYRHILAC